MDNQYWQIMPGNNTEYFMKVKDPEGWRHAEVKWDGCVHYYRYFNTPMGLDPQNDAEMTDYIPICSIDEEIARLQALKRFAAQWFDTYGRVDHNFGGDEVEGSIVAPLMIEAPHG